MVLVRGKDSREAKFILNIQAFSLMRLGKIDEARLIQEELFEFYSNSKHYKKTSLEF